MHHFPIFHLPSFVFRTAYLHRRRLFSITVIWWSVDGGNRKQGALLYEYNLLDGENSSAAQREKGINACIGKQIKRKKKSQTQVHQLWLFHLFSVQSWARAHTTAITNRVAYRTEKEEMREKGRTGDRYRQKEMFSIKSHNPTKYFLLTKYTGSGQFRHSFYSLNGSHH